jgi:hypothetical protein
MSSEVLAELRARGITVALEGDALTLEPDARVTDADLARVQADRAAIVDQLTGERDAVDVTPEAVEPAPVAPTPAPRASSPIGSGTGALDPLGAEDASAASDAIAPIVTPAPGVGETGLVTWRRVFNAGSPPPPAEGPMVVAVKPGFYDESRVRPGDVFRLRRASDFSPRWMRPYASDEDAAAPPPADAVSHGTGALDPLEADQARALRERHTIDRPVWQPKPYADAQRWADYADEGGGVLTEFNPFDERRR